MRKIVFSFAIAAVAALAFGSFTQAQPGKTRSMRIAMSGKAEVPGPGDPDGSGTFNLTFNQVKGEVCYQITVKKVQAVTAAHIHVGAAGQSGDPKVTFNAGTNGTWKGCASADKALISDIIQNPRNYYVNVHNAEFPNGALRGQLGK